MKKPFLILGGVVILAIALVLYNKQPSESNQIPDDQLLGSTPTNVNDTIAGNVWYGILKKSDNPSRGNLMLVSPGMSTKYIQTSRDFSNLIDKEVAMEVKGPVENFQLINIHPKN